MVALLNRSIDLALFLVAQAVFFCDRERFSRFRGANVFALGLQAFDELFRVVHSAGFLGDLRFERGGFLLELGECLGVRVGARFREAAFDVFCQFGKRFVVGFGRSQRFERFHIFVEFRVIGEFFQVLLAQLHAKVATAIDLPVFRDGKFVVSVGGGDFDIFARFGFGGAARCFAGGFGGLLCRRFVGFGRGRGGIAQRFGSGEDFVRRRARCDAQRGHFAAGVGAGFAGIGVNFNFAVADGFDHLLALGRVGGECATKLFVIRRAPLCLFQFALGDSRFVADDFLLLIIVMHFARCRGEFAAGAQFFQQRPEFSAPDLVRNFGADEHDALGGGEVFEDVDRGFAAFVFELFALGVEVGQAWIGEVALFDLAYLGFNSGELADDAVANGFDLFESLGGEDDVLSKELDAFDEHEGFGAKFDKFLRFADHWEQVERDHADAQHDIAGGERVFRGALFEVAEGSGGVVGDGDADADRCGGWEDGE